MLNVRNKLKQLTALTLAGLTALSSPISVLADNGLGGNASGSSQGGVVTSSGGDFGVNVSPTREGRIGIRLSLVDGKEPSRVISVDPDGKPQVVDILYVNENVFNGFTQRDNAGNVYLTELLEENEYSAVKTQSYTEKNEIFRVYYDELMSELGDKLGGDMQPWAIYYDNAYHSLGEEFTTWCVSDKDGNLKTASGQIMTVTTNAQGQQVQISPAGDGNNKVMVDGELAYSSSINLKSYDDFHNYYQKNGTKVLLGPAATSDTMYLNQMNILKLQREKGNISDSEYETLKSELDEIKVKVGATYSSTNTNNTSIFAKLKEKFMPSQMTVYAAEGDGGNVAEGGTISDSRIETLLTLTYGNTKLLQTKSMLEKNIDKITDAEEDWILLVEPIIYLTIFETGNDRSYLIKKQYGTISNIAEAIKEKVGGSAANKAKYGFFNWKAMGPIWGALHVSDSIDKETGATIPGFKFPNGDILRTPANVGSYVSLAELAGQNVWQTVGDHKEKVGYGVNVYYKGDMISTTSTSTWDEVNYPDGLPGPSEDCTDDSSFPKETEYGENSKKFNIVKWYYFERADGSQEVVDTRTREDVPHKVVVENEGTVDSDFYWEVDKWGTSLNDTDFPEDGSTNTTFEEYYKKYKGTYSGKEPNIVTINPDEPDKSIYVKLIMRVIPKKNIDIVRVYENEDGSSTVETELSVPYTDNVDGTSPKPEYTFEGSKTTPDPIKTVTSWNEVTPIPGTDGTTPSIPVKETDKTVYIHYKEKPGSEPTPSQLILHENEISKQFNLSLANGGSLLDGIREYSSVSVSGRCPEEWYCSNDDCSGHRCNDRYSYDYSDDWHFTITNNEDYGSNKLFTWAWQQTDQKDYTGNGLSESGGTGTSTPNGEIILQRTINDTVTLYPGLNGSTESKLQEMGIKSPSYIPAGARKDGIKDQPTRKTWNENFKTNWQFSNVNNPLSHWSTDHGYTKTDAHTSTGNEADLNAAYSKSGNTTVYGLWGKANSGITVPDETSNLSNARWIIDGLSVTFTPVKEHLKTSNITFYPYYKMKFTSEINGAEQDAYLTAENLSTVLNVQRVDTSITGNNTKNGNNALYLDSTQWSIHSKAQTLLANNGVQDSRSLLPAGAIFTLSDGQSSGGKTPDKFIGFHLYSTYVGDKSKLASQDGIQNESEVMAQINAFKEETKKVIEGYEIQLFGAEGIISDVDDFQKEYVKITGSAGIAGEYKIGTSKFNKDTSKYDLKTPGDYTVHSSEANRSDIDIKSATEKMYDWMLSSDADGNVKVYRDGVELASLTKTQGVSSITNADVKEFDNRTKLVTNYVAALDRNLGSDRTGNKWYNEGWNELHCKELRLAYAVGFASDGGSAGQRTAALNIKANGVLDNRQDMFNGDKAKNRTWRFMTSEKSLAAPSKPVCYVGTFNGTEVYIPGIQRLFTSKLFYTSNTTVMDLN